MCTLLFVEGVTRSASFLLLLPQSEGAFMDTCRLLIVSKVSRAAARLSWVGSEHHSDAAGTRCRTLTLDLVPKHFNLKRVEAELWRGAGPRLADSVTRLLPCWDAHQDPWWLRACKAGFGKDCSCSLAAATDGCSS